MFLLSQPSDYVVGFSAGVAALSYAVRQVVTTLRPVPAAQPPAVNGYYVTRVEFEARHRELREDLARIEGKIDRIDRIRT